MYKLKYVGVTRRGLKEWVFPTYREVVRVVDGKAQVKYPETVDRLKRFGFVLDEEEEKPPTVEPKTPEPNVVDLFNQGLSVTQISRRLKMPRKEVARILEEELKSDASPSRTSR